MSPASAVRHGVELEYWANRQIRGTVRIQNGYWHSDAAGKVESGEEDTGTVMRQGVKRIPAQ